MASPLSSSPAAAVPATLPVPQRGGLSLRVRINLLVGVLNLLFAAVLLWQQVDATRRSVHEEIVAGNRVATQLLQRVILVYQMSGSQALRVFLEQLGRVRANEIRLVDTTGRELYRSPPSVYKRGRDAPAWFSERVVPPLQRQVIDLPGGRLLVEADPSRAILDGWDDLLRVASLAGGAIVLINGLVFWFVGRTLRPFPRIVAGLERLQQGDYATRLPVLAGREAGSIGAAVNRMAEAIEENLSARLRAFEAERRLSESREIARRIEHHTELERRAIARELHDELGQSVVAIRSVATSLARRLAPHDEAGRAMAALVSDEAARLYDKMHGLIPRLSPMALDSLGLADALEDLVAGLRQRPDAPPVLLRVDEPLPSLEADTALAAYRVVQEGLNNALRHAAASEVRVTVASSPGGLAIEVRDNGRGLPADWERPGHYGVRGLRERVRSRGGDLALVANPAGGTCLRADLPTDGTVPAACAAPAEQGDATGSPA